MHVILNYLTIPCYIKQPTFGYTIDNCYITEWMNSHNNNKNVSKQQE